MPDLSHTGARIRRAVEAALAVFRAKKPGEAGYRELGRMGEAAAEGLLRSLGYSVLGRNVQVPMGEADIVCRDCDRETFVIVEVKTRLRRADAPAKSNEVLPEASITAHKRRKLLSIARHLTRANKWRPSFVRIDVVAVEYHAEDSKGMPVMRHHIGAVRG
jgi:Holliday junction resolvase-like predicted endonuclease